MRSLPVPGRCRGCRPAVEEGFPERMVEARRARSVQADHNAVIAAKGISASVRQHAGTRKPPAFAGGSATLLVPPPDQ